MFFIYYSHLRGTVRRPYLLLHLTFGFFLSLTSLTSPTTTTSQIFVPLYRVNQQITTTLKTRLNMIRLNVFFEVKDAAQTAEIKALCQESVEKSLKDNGNVAYDYFVSGTREGVMMICET